MYIHINVYIDRYTYIHKYIYVWVNIYIYVYKNIYIYTLMKNPQGWAESIRDGFLRGSTSTLWATWGQVVGVHFPMLLISVCRCGTCFWCKSSCIHPFSPSISGRPPSTQQVLKHIAVYRCITEKLCMLEKFQETSCTNFNGFLCWDWDARHR